MINIINRARIYLVLMIVAGVFFTAGGVLAAENNYQPITRQLMDLLDQNQDIKTMLERSIEQAKTVNPDLSTNPVQTLPAYYDFVDRISELLPQDILESPSGLTKDNMLQGISYFYFLVDQPLQELADKELFKSSIQYYEPFSTWLRAFVKTWGAFLDTEESWSETIYEQIYHDPRFGLQEGWYESPENWKTFNQFFARYLLSPDMRPIASPEDPSIVVAPADSEPQGEWIINEHSEIMVENGLNVKGIRYFSVNELLGKESSYQDAFAGGVLTHTFLNVNDYHRYHFAVGGEVKEVNILSQNVALEVLWDQETGNYIPIDSTGWQFTQTRGVVIVDTDQYGLVALIPMGMAQVSSVNFEKSITPGSIHEKGDMLGNFYFGGSDFVMLFQEKAGFTLTAPVEKHLLMGDEYGKMIGAD